MLKYIMGYQNAHHHVSLKTNLQELKKLDSLLEFGLGKQAFSLELQLPGTASH